MMRVLMRAHDNGQEFPVYVETEAEAQDAAATLKATIVRTDPANATMLQIEQLTTMFSRAFGYR